MQNNASRYVPILSGLIISLSLSVLLINSYFFKFPGNNYFPEDTPLLALILFINYLGLIVFFGTNTRASNSGKELLYFFGVMCLIALATNAVQLTPFPPIDVYIVRFESKLNINMVRILEWTNTYPWFKYLLNVIYSSIHYQMSIIPLLIIATGRFYLLRDYYFLLLVTAIIGFAFYYFFPTTAPASIISSSLFSPEQIATGYKFNQIHSYINPTTNEGGLIALPSFHTVWALFCVYLLKEWIIPCIILLVINVLLITSCVLLGWHYPIDILGGFILAAGGYYLLSLTKSRPAKSQ
ncbi:phosphatase PAP2 family protein [Legionella bononiensis]|uniref:phosphatase PAP2 family protein n=1 Tax=Legionella bononiensis TaxID=2793102 RepID=UPI001932D905|nr:phosphatase PAP2 family protein [Legionella bononiensis]MBL7478851.1 phosphatase PAP2 family protein [Legionella bononiensis]MBL7562425.1 phosphatase PAP2 family protein [Legionella bononiensis]